MSKQVLLKKSKCKSLSYDQLINLSKEDLVDHVLQLEAHIIQLKNIINRNNNGDESSNSRGPKKAFDFSKCVKRHVFLKLYYLGWDYKGFAVQEDSTETIEHYLFSALIKCCLIESRQTSNYHRCGRTDKGVSSFGQVISIDLRSKLAQHILDSNPNIIDGELPYASILNRLLPDNIRILAWCPVSSNYSARFDCKERFYKYFFPRGNLNIEIMNSAAQLFVGKHDFRNLCKMDVGNGVTEFIRVINEADVSVVHKESEHSSGYDMCVLSLKGVSFLWHQVRCIMGILLLIGEGKEKPEIFKELLDVEKNPRKPQYNMASEVPLNLFHCTFEIADWHVDPADLKNVICSLQKIWTNLDIRSKMVYSMLKECEYILGDEVPTDLSTCLLQGSKPKVYQPIMKRPLCESLEKRIDHYVKRKRLQVLNTDATDRT